MNRKKIIEDVKGLVRSFLIAVLWLELLTLNFVTMLSIITIALPIMRPITIMVLSWHPVITMFILAGAYGGIAIGTTYLTVFTAYMIEKAMTIKIW